MLRMKDVEVLESSETCRKEAGFAVLPWSQQSIFVSNDMFGLQRIFACLVGDENVRSMTEIAGVFLIDFVLRISNGNELHGLGRGGRV